MALTAAPVPVAAAVQDSGQQQVAGSEDDGKTVQTQTDEAAKSAEDNTTEEPLLSPSDEFKPSEDVSEDLSIPFPVDI